jgi:hypothetical protein
MNAEEVKKTNEELKTSISEVLWAFADKHSLGIDKDTGYQVVCIMQAVLSESSSDLEYQLGRQAPFTTRQIDHICYQIGDWYLMMKPLLEGQHNLGFMKEKLKTMICGD